MAFVFDASSLEWQELLALFRVMLHTPQGHRALDTLYPRARFSIEFQEEARQVQELISYYQTSAIRLAFREIGRIACFPELALEGYLASPEEVYPILEMLELWESLRFSLEEAQVLIPYVRGLPKYHALLKQLRWIFAPNGGIRDDASPELAKIRLDKARLHLRIKQQLEDLMQRHASSFPEKYVTLRQGRYVLPIRRSDRHVVPSQLRAISHTGQRAFIEPRSVMDQNDQLLNLGNLEQEAIMRIFQKLTPLLQEQCQALQRLDEALGQLEWIHARAQYAVQSHAHYPQMREEPSCRLVHAVHPLLCPDKAKGIDIEIDAQKPGLLISGPNAGGKTVALKTLGLLIVMHHHGIPIPASPESFVGEYTCVLLESGDKQSIDMGLSSFTGHLRGLQRLLGYASSCSLLLIDEVGDNTSPLEGEALAKGLVLRLLQTKAQFVITSHFSGLNALFTMHHELENATMLFDERKHQPLFRLKMGAMGGSHALDTARNMGFDAEVLRFAQDALDAQQGDADRLLHELTQEQHRLAEQERAFQEQMRAEQDALEIARQALEAEKQLLLQQGVAAIHEELASLQATLSEVRHEVLQTKKTRLTQVQQESVQAAQQILKQSKIATIEATRSKASQVRVQDEVWIASLAKKAKIDAIDHNQIWAYVGNIRMAFTFDDVFELYPAEKSYPVAKVQKDILSTGNHSVDLRGQRVDEALRHLEKAIDAALIAGCTSMEVIHGRGTGALREAIATLLREHPHILKFQFARADMGGDGKTEILFS